jgi:UDP-glucose 4-epimerase
MPERAVVLGGGGFIGSHIADELSAAGCDVVVFDRFKSKWLTQKQEMIVGDVLDIDKLSEALIGASLVVNCAAIADLNAARDLPMLTANVNIVGNINVLEVCRKLNVKHYVYASSIYVNSDKGGFYRCSKQAAEAYVEEYFKRYGLAYTILRYGSLYGPRSDDSNGLYRIVKNAILNNEIIVDVNPESLREYINVLDAAKLTAALTIAPPKNGALVITGAESVRMDDLLKTLAEILSISNSRISYNYKECDGHYIRTPYSFKRQLSKKINPNAYIDIGQGLLELIEEVSQKYAQG